MSESTLIILTLAGSIASLVFSGLAASMFLANLPLFSRSVAVSTNTAAAEWDVSILIPARDEEAGIAASVRAALASEGVTVEVLVRDDASTDRTAAIVREIALSDPRVRLLCGDSLPSGWNGKQHGCARLAESARYERLLFLDADVRLQPGAVARLCRQLDAGVGARRLALLSAFPHQVTGTFWEKLLIPMMHQILLCYLPMARMRASTSPAYAAGCGQLFLTRRADYVIAGTHAAIRATRHDGLKLPRLFRQAGLLTDCIDGTSLAECRMYTSGPQVVRGLLKNAYEGIANPRLIVPFTMLLGGAAVLPWITLVTSLSLPRESDLVVAATLLSGIAILFSFLPRVIAANHFRQSWLGVVLHPLAVIVFLTIQWIAIVQYFLGVEVAWRGRTRHTLVKG